MSMATLERAILIGAKIIFKNQKLKMKDIQEWSSGRIKAEKGESVAYVPDPGVYVAIKAENDKNINH